MSRGLKIWLFWWGFAASVLIIVGRYVGFHHARLLLWTFGQSETAIGGWMGILGYSPLKATSIGVIGGFIAVTHHYFASDLLGPILKKLGIVSKTEAGRSKLYLEARKAPYLMLPVLSFLPDGGSLISILFAKACKLNRWTAFALIQLGNIAKNIAYGLGFTFISLIKRDVTFVAYAIMIGSSLVLIAPHIKSICSATVARIARRQENKRDGP